MKNKSNRNIIIALIGLLFFAGFSLSLSDKLEPVSITVLPEVPREDIPFLISFDLNNPSLQANNMSYEFYANGRLLMQGTTLLFPLSSRKYSYVYPETPKPGERITFLVKSNSEQGNYEKVLSMPAYPPQVWSSFVSFASFSTSLMGSSMGSTMGINTELYYSKTFTESGGLNVGLIFSIVLILLLIYLELTEPLIEKGFSIIGMLRLRFGRLSAVLFIIFIGIVLTKVAMIIG
ncbi:MAG: hypothetical protein O8C64_10195 [Candidatus Methanoperedens sp.]|nr:hypothetical protein [Candidatus Methanoperedens sp.]MCZ7406585.1 hypothetical protein [Candidatus Methanoperedens sp.]